MSLSPESTECAWCWLSSAFSSRSVRVSAESVRPACSVILRCEPRLEPGGSKNERLGAKRGRNVLHPACRWLSGKRKAASTLAGEGSRSPALVPAQVQLLFVRSEEAEAIKVNKVRGIVCNPHFGFP